jgi:hypothetical protein
VDYRTPNIYDPSTLTQPYAYANGNPIMFYDPDGREVTAMRFDQSVGLEIWIDKDKEWAAYQSGELSEADLTDLIFKEIVRSYRGEAYVVNAFGGDLKKLIGARIKNGNLSTNFGGDAVLDLSELEVLTLYADLSIPERTFMFVPIGKPDVYPAFDRGVKSFLAEVLAQEISQQANIDAEMALLKSMDVYVQNAQNFNRAFLELGSHTGLHMAEDYAGGKVLHAGVSAFHMAGAGFISWIVNRNRQVGNAFADYVLGTKLAKLHDMGLVTIPGPDRGVSFPTPDIPGKTRVIPDFVFESPRSGKMLALGDAKAYSYVKSGAVLPEIPFDEQAEGFIKWAATTEKRTFIYYVPWETSLDPELLKFARRHDVKLKVIVVP